MNDYREFINNKHFRQPESGFSYKCADNSPLRDYQRAAVEWALARGKAAIFKDTGLGKTLDGLEFGKAVVNHTQSPVLLLTPVLRRPTNTSRGSRIWLRYKANQNNG